MGLAILLRAVTVILSVAGYLLIQHTTVESAFVARYFRDPEADKVARTIAVFRAWNHLDIVVVSLVSSILAAKLAMKLLGGRVALGALALAPGLLFFTAFSLLVQGLPVWYLAIFFVLGVVAVLCQQLAARRWFASGRVGSWLSGFYLRLPFLAEIVTPHRAFREVYGFRSSRSALATRIDRLLSWIAPVHTVLVVCLAASYAVAISAINAGWLPDVIKGRRVERLVAGNYHGLEIDRGRRRLLATNLDFNRLDGYSLDALPQRLFALDLPTTELENIRINPERDELYHFDRGTNRLRVYRAEDLSLKRESTVEIRGDGTAQVEFDNESKTILVAMESDAVWIFDIDSLALLHENRQAGFGNADVLFSSLLKKYVLSYSEAVAAFRTLTPAGGRYEEFACLLYQNDIQESPQRRELYLSLPVEGAVYAYDSADLHRARRVLATMFGVRGIAYDRTHDLLLTASMVTGYVHVLDVGTGRILDRVFVGYYLREIQLDEERREAFISSPIGGVYRFRY